MPPSESCSKRVSLESAVGTCSFQVPRMQFQGRERWLMEVHSAMRWLVNCLRVMVWCFIVSDPARSARFSGAEHAREVLRPVGGCSSRHPRGGAQYDLRFVRRDECSFMLAAATARWLFPKRDRRSCSFSMTIATPPAQTRPASSCPAECRALGLFLP